MKTKTREKKYNPKGVLYKLMLALMAFTIITILSGEYLSGEKIVITNITLSFLLMIIIMGIHQMYPLGYLGEVKTVPAIIAIILPYFLVIIEFIMMHFVGKNLGSRINFPDVLRVVGMYTLYAISCGIYFDRNEVVIKEIKEGEDNEY